MTALGNRPPASEEAAIIGASLALQEEGLRLLFAEIRALQAMIPAGDRELPTDAETESGFDNMPV